SPLFPNEEGISSNQGHTGEEKPLFKRPEFIIIDDRRGKNRYTHFGTDSMRKPKESFQKEENRSSKGPISLRFICVLGLIFCTIFGLGMFLWSIAMTF